MLPIGIRIVCSPSNLILIWAEHIYGSWFDLKLTGSIIFHVSSNIFRFTFDSFNQLANECRLVAISGYTVSNSNEILDWRLKSHVLWGETWSKHLGPSIGIGNQLRSSLAHLYQQHHHKWAAIVVSILLDSIQPEIKSSYLLFFYSQTAEGGFF